MKRFLLVALLAGLALTAAGCGGESTATTQPSSRLVSPAEFASAVAEQDTVTINVLGPGVQSIPGTDLAIHADELVARESELPSRSTRLAVYCAHGNTSARAVRTLEALGFESIVELRGGMAAWAASGRRLLPA